MMLVASKEGRVRVLEQLEAHSSENKEDAYMDVGNVILDLSSSSLSSSSTDEKLCTNGQRGLHSIAIHPDFLETRWVYLYYTRWRQGCLEDASLGPQNVLVRYTMNPTTLALENEELLLECGILRERIRNGGGMMFGTDGFLYLATGDGGVRTNAQERTNLQGSLLRVKDDGSIPEDNPYFGVGFPCGKTAGVVPINVSYIGKHVYCAEVYSWGFRNPIRMTLNLDQSNVNTTLFSISDVGADSFEELSWAGTEFKAKNYGWPEWEGPCAFDTAEPDCPVPSPDSNLVDPFHYYAHASSQKGGSVGGSAFVPDGSWPSEYHYLFMDTERQAIYNLNEDADAECRESCSPPNSAFVATACKSYTIEFFFVNLRILGSIRLAQAIRFCIVCFRAFSKLPKVFESTKENDNEAIIDMFFGPDGESNSLYVIKHGNYSSIHRIRYTGLPPEAVIEVGNKEQHDNTNAAGLLPVSTTNNVFSVGETVWFDAGRSTDPDGGELFFQWDFGDQSSSSNSSNPSHVYNERGEYTVFLVVTNSNKKNHVASTVVVVGKFPSVAMLSPVEGDLFTVGEMLRLNAVAYDSQGNVIPDDQMTWSIRQYHSDGFDFLLDETSGNNFQVNPFPEQADYASTEILFLSVVLFVTDDSGMVTKVVTDVYPENQAGTIIDVKPPKVDIPSDADVSSRPNSPETQVEPVRKPVIFNISNIVPEDDVKLSQARGSNGLDGESQEGEIIYYTYGLRTSWKWLIGISMTILLIAPIYLGYKYYRLKHKLDNDSNYPSQPTVHDKSSQEFRDKSMPSASAAAASGEEENISTCVMVSDETKISSSSSTSNASFSSNTSMSVNQSDIWDRIAEETERRAKLRAKYSTAGAASPTTPETMDTKDSPSNSDPNSSSPAKALATNIDETLVRLDDLLAKCFTRKSRKDGRNDDSFDSSLEEGENDADLNADEKESSEHNALTPVWLSSSHQKSATGSPSPGKNDESFVEATFSMSSLYSSGSSPNVSNESSAIHLPDVSRVSNQSLLIFQDNDLSMSNKESSTNESDLINSLMESGMTVDGDKMTSADVSTVTESHLLIGNGGDPSDRSDHLLIKKECDDLAEKRESSQLTEIGKGKSAEERNNRRFFTESEKDDLLNGNALRHCDEKVESTNVTTNLLDESSLLIGNEDLSVGDWESAYYSNVASFDEDEIPFYRESAKSLKSLEERRMLLKKVDALFQQFLVDE